MKLPAFFITVLLSIACCYSQQTMLDSVRISGCIPVKHSDHTDWIKRYQTDVDKYDKENGTLKDFSCDVLFLGSSSINLWHNIYTDLAPLKIIRRSYGGSTVRDNIYNYNTIARGYKPKKIVVYIENDLGNWKESITPGECYDLFRVFVQLLQRDYPEIPVYIISLKPSFSKIDQLADQLIVNRLLKDYADITPYVEFIDITQGMYGENGQLREDIFIEDRLHMNQKGYDIWIKEIKPVLMKDLDK